MLWDILIGVLFLGAARYGEYVSDECPQAGYTCPKICDVDHKHLPIKECKNAKTLQEQAEGKQGLQEGDEGTCSEEKRKPILIEE